MLDPAAIGTTIIWLEAERRREADIERQGSAAPVKSDAYRRRLGRSLARRFRSSAEELEPTVVADPQPC